MFTSKLNCKLKSQLTSKRKSQLKSKRTSKLKSKLRKLKSKFKSQRKSKLTSKFKETQINTMILYNQSLPFSKTKLYNLTTCIII